MRAHVCSQHAHSSIQSLLRQRARTTHIRTHARGRGLKHARTASTQTFATKYKKKRIKEHWRARTWAVSTHVGSQHARGHTRVKTTHTHKARTRTVQALCAEKGVKKKKTKQNKTKLKTKIKNNNNNKNTKTNANKIHTYACMAHTTQRRHSYRHEYEQNTHKEKKHNTPCLAFSCTLLQPRTSSKFWKQR